MAATIKTFMREYAIVPDSLMRSVVVVLIFVLCATVLLLSRFSVFQHSFIGRSVPTFNFSTFIYRRVPQLFMLLLASFVFRKLPIANFTGHRLKVVIFCRISR